MEEESIYNLIPKEYVPPPRESRYKSNYPNKLPPTGSTLINHTTSRPGVKIQIIKYIGSKFKG
jgi:hypothetical protein